MNREDFIRIANDAELGHSIWIDDDDEVIDTLELFARMLLMEDRRGRDAQILRLIAEEREACKSAIGLMPVEVSELPTVVKAIAVIHARGQQ